MSKGILGKKIGMTQLYTEQGTLIPVTLIEAGPCPILEVKEKSEGKDIVVRLGFDKKREARTTKSELGSFKKAGSKGAFVSVKFSPSLLPENFDKQKSPTPEIMA